jgi:hypothetical protein
MTHTTRALVASLLVIAAAACSKTKDGDGKASGKVVEPAAPKANYVPCEAAALDALEADLTKANCLNVDLTDKAITDACEAKAKEISGKTYALKGCTFSSQGNDEVSFGATGSDKQVRCVMKGGEAGVKDFRQAAMALDMAKLRLDVTGTIALAGSKDFQRLQMTDCQISAHE